MGKVCNFESKTSKIRISVIIVVLFAVCYRLFGFYYSINDDISIQAILSGKSFGTPDAHSVFIQYPLGVVIAGLFRVLPGIDWYGSFWVGSILACCIISFLRMAKLINQHEHKALEMVFGALFFVVFVFDELIFFQYTTVAGMLAATALFLLVTEQNEKFTAAKFLIIVLYIMSMCVRKKVFIMFVPVTGLVVLFRLINGIQKEKTEKVTEKCRNSIKRNKSFVLVGIALLISYVLVTWINTNAYSNSEWKEYFAFKTYRSDIVDYGGFPAYSGNEALYESIGVSEEEQACLSSFFGVLPDIDSEKLRVISYKKSLDKTASRRRNISNAISVMKSVLTSESGLYWKLSLWVGILFVLLCVPFKKVLSAKIPILAFVITQLGIAAYLCFSGRFPARVLFSFYLQCLVILFGYFLVYRRDSNPSERHPETEKKLLVFAIGVMALFAATTVYSTWISAGSYKQGIAAYQEYVDLTNSDPDRFYIVPTGAVSSKKQFTIRNEQIEANAIGTTGWSSKSPWQLKKLQEAGIDVEEEYLLQDGVYMLARNFAAADLLTEYYMSEGWIDEGYEVVDTLEGPAAGTFYVLRWTGAE